MACQSMDNQIMIFGVLNRFRQNRKKAFKGHMVSRRSVYHDFAFNSPKVYVRLRLRLTGFLNLFLKVEKQIIKHKHLLRFLKTCFNSFCCPDQL